ncbi:MAG: glucosidase [Planctomycetaceae bacterium]|nr:glucosidase [Planctomycetaceae bacterium]
MSEFHSLEAATPLEMISRSSMACHHPATAEHKRLSEDAAREKNWKRWGPYLAERQWGTVREDYSANGEPWHHFPHDHARSRIYRWGEDGLLGIADRQCRVCFAWGLWNQRDPILKERFFGLTGPEGNHGEDVKELYYYLDSTPTHSYMRALYKYPQAEYPYLGLLQQSQRRSRKETEYELEDTGIFAHGAYFDFHVTYAKQSDDHLLIQADIINRGQESAPLHVLPTVWFRNTWTWPTKSEQTWKRPRLFYRADLDGVVLQHDQFENPYALRCGAPQLLGRLPEITLADLPVFQPRRQDRVPASDPTSTSDVGETGWLFTENETNRQRLYNYPNATAWVKDGFHERIVNGREQAVCPHGQGTKSARWISTVIPPGEVLRLRLRLGPLEEVQGVDFESSFDRVLAARKHDADEYYAARQPPMASEQTRQIQRQSDAGLLWTKQFYHFVTEEWLDLDRTEPAGHPARRTLRRNAEWPQLYNRDIISMPDKWEYPWYAAWDLAFHTLPLANLDPQFAKQQLLLFLREWYMHSNGQLPAYEWAFSDVNPPVHAWACWKVFELTRQDECGDLDFLKHCFMKLLLNFTWWVNRKDPRGNNLFSGGFLGLDNIGVFDRSKPLPTGGFLEQADGTAWMAFYCRNMLTISLHLGMRHSSFSDMASKFFEHYMGIAEAMNLADGRGLWDEQDGFYYDHLLKDGQAVPLRVRSIVGLLPLISVQVIHDHALRQLSGFRKRMQWFLDYHENVGQRMTYLEKGDSQHGGMRLLAIPSVERLKRLLRYMLDEQEFLSPFGIRSLSRFHERQPYLYHVGSQTHRVDYLPGESDSGMFGGNSNWRGPIWFPLNYLLIEALDRYHQFYGESFKTECPVGSGQYLTLGAVAMELRRRLLRLFEANKQGVRPSQPTDRLFPGNSAFSELTLFHEYFHAETGLGLGASHQTGWTALISQVIDQLSFGG